MIRMCESLAWHLTLNWIDFSQRRELEEGKGSRSA
jgi:hypothetical protein